MTPAESRTRPGPAWLRPVVAVIGLVYLALGIIGWLTPETATVGHVTTNRVAGLFSASALLNLVHTVIGVLGLLAATRRAGSLIYCWVIFVGFLGMTAYGILATAFSNPDDPINLNWADNLLHGLTAVVGLAVGIVATRATTRPVSAADRRVAREDTA
jgi:hypothetical protein